MRTARAALERIRAGDAVAPLLTLLLAACGQPATEPPAPPASLEALLPQRPRILATIPTVAVTSRRGPGGSELRTTRRTDRISQYPCGACHTAAIAAAVDTQVSRRWSHLDIRPRHAEALDCSTCHDYADLGRLRLLDGDPVGFDHSYQVCGQCHFEQARDWAGGAHGKRLGGWRGERVVQSCTGCHDPHAPAFAQRMPRLYPRVPRTGR